MPPRRTAPTELARTPRAIFLFWLPLALQWIMMALEGPFLAAVIARLADPTFNLAAYGVAFAFAILVESPVIMLMSASTALVEDWKSYRKLRAFAQALNALSTALLVLLLFPPVFDLVLRGGLGLPPEVADLVYGALWILLPWPAAIGYRRFLHGIMIRAGQTRLVMFGTMIRLAGMVATGILLSRTGIPGAWVGAGALSAGVVIEAGVARLMSRRAIASLREREGDAGVPVGRHGAAGEAAPRSGALPERPPSPSGSPPRGAAAAAGASSATPSDTPGPRTAGASQGAPPVHPPGAPAAGGGARTQSGASAALGAGGRLPHEEGEPELTFGTIARFYYPLALTSFIGLTTQPILTFFMGRAPAPVESLALFPVVMALYFVFGTFGLSYQEAAIALVGRKGEYRREVGGFARWLALAASGGLALIAFTPLARGWFEGVSGLEPGLAALAFVPAQVIALAPALSVIMGFQRALLVQARRTRPITVATVIEVTAIAVLFPLYGWGMGLMGVTAAMAALVTGRSMGVVFLWWRVREITREREGG